MIKQDIPFYAGGFMGILRKKSGAVLMKYLWAVLTSAQYRMILGQGSTGANINNLGANLGNIKIPLPPLEIQQAVVDEIEAIERKEATYQENMEILRRELFKPEYFQFQDQRLGDISVMAKRGKSAKYGNSSIQIIKSGQARGYLEFDFSEKHFVADGFTLDERKLEKGDILINSTGVGTAGRVTLFDLEGDFVVDSHITIVRLDKNRVLPKYALYALANIGFKQIEAMADGQSGQIELPIDAILAIKIPLPPVDVQQEIVERMQQAENEIARLNAELSALKAEKDSVLKKYL